jgi:integrase
VSRIPRSSLLYIALVAMLGMVFWFTWQSMENGSKGDAWSYSQLLTKADQGQVTKVDIKGSGATATDKGGSRHEVQLPDTGTDFLQQQLYKDNVDFSFQPPSGASWLAALLPNLILLLLIGGFMYDILRQTQSGTNQAMSILAYLLTGRRRSEVLNLRWRDLDLEGGFYRYSGKGGKERQRALPPPVRLAIPVYAEAAGLARKLGMGMPPDFLPDARVNSRDQAFC